MAGWQLSTCLPPAPCFSAHCQKISRLGLTQCCELAACGWRLCWDLGNNCYSRLRMKMAMTSDWQNRLPGGFSYYMVSRSSSGDSMRWALALSMEVSHRDEKAILGHRLQTRMCYKLLNLMSPAFRLKTLWETQLGFGCFYLMVFGKTLMKREMFSIPFLEEANNQLVQTHTQTG